MEVSQLDPAFQAQTRPDEPELDLYTIPSRSSWFAWDEIHETERVSLREFFDGSSFTRTPKIYKEYREFIINKYREEPSRSLRFTEVRKSLVGDVNLLRKVFSFLENWGLINFSASPAAAGDDGGGGDGGKCEEEEGESSGAVPRVIVSVEKGVPSGIRVAAMPNSMKPITAPENQNEDSTAGAAAAAGFKFPPLASYSDVFANSIRLKDVVVCGICGDSCNSGHYQFTQGDFSICVKCFESGNYGENKTIDDYKLIEGVQDSRKSGAVWSEAETLLLLESVLKYGDDWELVARNFPTKTKLDCISKLIELPLGDVLGSTAATAIKTGGSLIDLTGNSISSTKEDQETVEITEPNDEKTDEVEQNGDAVEQGPPTKRHRIDSLSGLGGSLMEQVAYISTMVDPHIVAAAADAAITSLCEENSWPREIFEKDHNGDGIVTDELDKKRGVDVEGDSEMEVRSTKSENQEKSSKNVDTDIPATLRIRTAVATALGAAAARAKLLADQEEREIEHLVATVIGTEVKKLQSKMRRFEELEAIVKKKRAEMDEIENVLLGERISALQAGFRAGVPRWKNHSFVKQ